MRTTSSEAITTPRARTEELGSNSNWNRTTRKMLTPSCLSHRRDLPADRVIEEELQLTEGLLLINQISTITDHG